MFLNQGSCIDGLGNTFTIPANTDISTYSTFLNAMNAAFAGIFIMNATMVNPNTNVYDNVTLSNNTKFLNWNIWYNGAGGNAGAKLTAYGNFMQLLGIHKLTTIS